MCFLLGEIYIYIYGEKNKWKALIVFVFNYSLSLLHISLWILLKWKMDEGSADDADATGTLLTKQQQGIIFYDDVFVPVFLLNEVSWLFVGL